MKRTISIVALAATLSACGMSEQEPEPPIFATVSVVASGQTEPVETVDDAADDPAIWLNPDDPASSLIVGTDKRAGLYVYGLDGGIRSFTPSPRLNNVDLVPGIVIGGSEAILVAASDREDEANGRIALYRLDPESAELILLGSVDAGPGEAYGICLHDDESDGLSAFVTTKEGVIYRTGLNFEGDRVGGTALGSFNVPSQPEGCVVDARTGTLYVGEEDVGIWAFDLASGEGNRVIDVDGAQLVDDVEGLALVARGDAGGWLVASSQGDNAFALYNLPGYEFAGRFTIVEGDGFDSVQETDGIAVDTRSFGVNYPEGLMVVQDGETPAGTQNFKFIDWRRIRAALELE